MMRVKQISKVYFCTYYKTLNVDQNASLNQIKQNFINLAKKHHPDVGQISDQQFIKIKKAYDTLRDPDLRKQYDYELIHGDPQSKQRSYHHYYGSDSIHNVIYQGISFYTIISRLGILLIMGYLTHLYLQPMTEHEIRRQNLIMSRENYDSSPSVQQKRRKMYLKQMQQKKVTSRIIDIKTSNGGQESMKMKNIKKNSIQAIPGIKKQVYKQENVNNQEYI